MDGCGAGKFGVTMIELLFSSRPRVLLVRYGTEITQKNLQRLDGALARFVGREGPCDTVVDFRSVPNTEFPPWMLAQRRRRRARSRRPGRRRIFVVRSAGFHGVPLLSGGQRDDTEFDPPMLVPTLEDALSNLDADCAAFAPA